MLKNGNIHTAQKNFKRNVLLEKRDNMTKEKIVIELEKILKEWGI